MIRKSPGTIPAVQTNGSLEGQTVVSDQAWVTIAESLHLSGRELQIARRLIDDKTELRIALELGISHHTVNTYLQRLYRKLNVSSRVQLVVRLLSEHPAFRKYRTFSRRAV